MAIETQVIPVVMGASEVINKTMCLAVFCSDLYTATLYAQKKNSMREKISFLASFLIMFPANRWFSRYVIAAMLVDGKQKIAH